MAIFTVHLPPESDRMKRLLGAAILKDSFSWGAFAYGPFWLMARRLWISALVVLLVLAGLWALVPLIDLPPLAALAATSLVGLFLGLEGQSLRRWRFARRGWSEEGVVAARSRDEAERRFFERLAAPPQRPARPPQATVSVTAPPGVIGLFPEPRTGG
jgi:hypothetical protein